MKRYKRQQVSARARPPSHRFGHTLSSRPGGTRQGSAGLRVTLAVPAAAYRDGVRRDWEQATVLYARAMVLLRRMRDEALGAPDAARERREAAPLRSRLATSQAALERAHARYLAIAGPDATISGWLDEAVPRWTDHVYRCELRLRSLLGRVSIAPALRLLPIGAVERAATGSGAVLATAGARTASGAQQMASVVRRRAPEVWHRAAQAVRQGAADARLRAVAVWSSALGAWAKAAARRRVAAEQRRAKKTQSTEAIPAAYVPATESLRPRRTAIVRLKKRPHHLKRLMWLSAMVVGGMVSFSAVSGAVVYSSIAGDFVSPEVVGINEPAGGAVILDRNGEVLYRYIDETTGLRTPVNLDQVSDHLLAATIATEDSNFYTNPGINPKGLARAAWENFSPFSGEVLEGSGGSSITQQLVKRVYFEPEDQATRSLDRKAREMIFALKLNDQYSKEQVLAWYLNEISYGGVYFGVEAASQGYFGKPAEELSLAEAALLAGIPQAPGMYDPRAHPEAAVSRRNQVLDLLATHASVQIREGEQYGVSLDEIEAAKNEPLQLAEQAPPVLYAPHFVLTYLQPEIEAMFGKDALLEDGLVIETTIDLKLQLEAERILEEHIAAFEADSNTHNGAAVVIDPRTGELLAMVGSRDYDREDIQGRNNNLISLNSPGSAFKPFVYLGLFLQDGMGPARPVDDSPLRYEQPDGTVFEPENPGGGNHGWVSVRDALGNSLNIPAFRAAEEVGVPEVVALGKQAGLTTLDGMYGPAIAIGGVDVRPLDLAYAYSLLASGGVMRGQAPAVSHEAGERSMDPVSILRVTRNDGSEVYTAESHRMEERVFPEQHTFLINSILTDPNAQCLTFGCGGLSVPGYQVAVKTGTSEPFDPEGPDAGKIGETWAFGYTPDVVAGIWAGNADNAPITNITSTSIAFRAMRDLVLAYYDGEPGTPFEPPDGVTRLRACFVQPVRGCATDWFLEESLRNGPVAAREAEPPRPPAPSSPPPAFDRPDPPRNRNEGPGDGREDRGRNNPPDRGRDRDRDNDRGNGRERGRDDD